MTEIDDKFNYEFEDQEMEITIIDIFSYEATIYAIGSDENEDIYVFEMDDDEEIEFVEDKDLQYQIVTHWLKKTASQENN